MSQPDTSEALHVQAQRALLDGLRRGDALAMTWQPAIAVMDVVKQGVRSALP